MKNLVVLFFIAMSPVSSQAEIKSVVINQGDTANVSCAVGPASTCPPVATPEPVVVQAPSIGNLHGAIHPTLAKTSRAACDTCHAVGKAVVKSDKVICAQFDFLPKGRTLIDPATGVNAVDPVSKTVVTSGGRTAVLKVGDNIECKTCHYPHKTSGSSVRESMIHTGCLDCHVGVKNDSLKPGIDD